MVSSPATFCSISSLSPILSLPSPTNFLSIRVVCRLRYPVGNHGGLQIDPAPIFSVLQIWVQLWLDSNRVLLSCKLFDDHCAELTVVAMTVPASPELRPWWDSNQNRMLLDDLRTILTVAPKTGEALPQRPQNSGNVVENQPSMFSLSASHSFAAFKKWDDSNISHFHWQPKCECLFGWGLKKEPNEPQNSNSNYS